jgi:hypothetical protein
MGWTGYVNDTRKSVDIVREELIGSGTRHRVIAHSGKYWVIEDIETNERFATIALVEKRNGDTYVKIVEESMGPFEVKCPLRFLDLLSPTDNEYALEWRQAVRDYHAQKASQPALKIGDTIEFDNPLEFTNGAKYQRLTYVGGYKFRTPVGFMVRMSKNWRTYYKWTIVS